MRLLIIENEWTVAHFIADIAIGQNIDIAGITQSYDEAIHILETEHVDLFASEDQLAWATTPATQHI